MTREEGFRKLFNGADWASGRAVLVTVGQLCFYDVVKERLLETGRFHDDTRTHLLSSVTAVSTTSASATRLEGDERCDATSLDEYRLPRLQGTHMEERL